jgi:4-hydroxy-tetrahydrodipicolinate synthase
VNDLVDGLRGVIAVLATPFDEDNAIDAEVLRANVRLSLESGVSGFLVPAYAGEVMKLSEPERLLVVETVLDEVAGRVTVIGGATAEDQNRMIGSAKALKSLGCRAVLANVSYAGDDEDYRRRVHEIADTEPELFMLQDVDGAGPGAPVETIGRLFKEIDQFKWIKTEVVGRCRKITELREKVGPGLRIGSAGMNYIEALDRGVDAYLPTVFHDLYVEVYRLHKNGDRDRAKEIFYSFLPMLTFTYSHASPIFNKRLLMRLGIYKNDRCRGDFAPFDAYETRLGEELIEQYMKIALHKGVRS